MKKLFVFLSLIFGLQNCISSKYLKQPSKDLAKLPVEKEIEGVYRNYSDSLAARNLEANYYSLWGALYFCKTFKGNPPHASANSTVEFNLDGRYLTGRLIQDGRVVDSLKLKVKIKGNYILIKRHLILLPIPFISFFYHEARAFLYFTSDACVSLSYRRKQFVWIIMAGDVDQRLFQCFEKVKQ